MEVKGAIFDMDGTLLESMGVWRTMRGRMLQSLGIELKEDFHDKVKGMNAQQQVEYIKETYGADLGAEGMDKLMHQVLSEFYAHEATPKEGLVDFLKLLKSKGIAMTVASATWQPLVNIALEAQGISDYFCGVFTVPEVGHNKHEPVIYDVAMEHMGCNKSNVVVFEDAIYAIRTCKKADYVVAGVKDDYEAAQDEVKELSDVYFEAYSPAVLEQLENL